MELIYSWTPKEFNNFLKGAQLRETDLWEREAGNALFTAKASNGNKGNKKIGLKDLYDGEKIRKQILEPKNRKAPELYLGRYRAAQAAMKAFRPQNVKKGG